MPKQYLQIGGRPILSHTVDAFRQVPEIQAVVVGIAPGDEFWSELHLDRDEKIYISRGGVTRAHTVLNGLRRLLDDLGADDSDWVMVHDAARPLVPHEDIQRLLTSCRSDGTGAILATPMVDTLKRADGSGRVIATEDRSLLWRALTPQCFPVGVLADAIESALVQGADVTDESTAMEFAGHPVRLVEGSPRNIKITVPYDLELARCLMEK